MTESADIAIVGGGAVGSSIAYFLTTDPSVRGRVVVIERDPSYANCSTTRSAGAIRLQFSTPENIELSKFGVEFLTTVGDRLAVDGDRPDVSFRRNAYLFLASDAGVSVLEQNHRVQRAHGADVALLSPGELLERFPWLNVEGLAMGALGLSREGWFDPYALLQAFKRKARAQGAIYLDDTVIGIERAGHQIIALNLARGGRLACGTVVNAAGPSAGKIAAMAGISLPVGPRKRFVYVFDCRAPLPRFPLLIDATGVWCRPEGASYICGVSPEEADDPECDDLELDYRLFDDVVWPTLAHRVPALEAIKLQRAWAGHYDYNALDQNGIIGRHPEVANFLFANGFSGHGIQQSPATGRAVAELIRHGRFLTIDLTRFGYERIARGDKLMEVNVV
ncbi:MAG: FAD-binding oxidoreductase [Alphaproteobacteria bacterium]|nr:FAD-binding oxidoreductase [Alphaproteobacteria bacterium]